MVYSFDVFDTLITRKTATPKGVFAYMQKKLQEEYLQVDSYIRNNFYELRIGAEEAAKSYFCNNQIREITFAQIYEAMKRTSCLTDTDIDLLMELEWEAEIELVVGIEKNIALLKKLYECNEKIILISDMYLDTETIRKMLIKADTIFKDIPLYVSSQTLKTKNNGSLFEYVKECENIDYSQWMHIGDNLYSDFNVPRKLGIAVKSVQSKELLPCESAALKNREDDIYLQFSIGASANARIMTNEDSKTLAYQYGTSLGGNIAYPYVRWLLRKSLDLGIKRLYFIARDGYLLKEIADSIIINNRYDISTFYIYGSRKAWRLAALSEECFDIISLVKWTGYKTLYKIEKIAEFFELDQTELSCFLPEEYKNRAGKIEVQELIDLAVYLESNHKFRSFLLKKQKEKHKLLVEYLQQNVDISDGKFAFVELIGSGYTQKILSYVMKEFCDFRIQTFFYHMDAMLDTDSCIFHCYFPMKMEDAGMMELFYSAPHGHTIGYAKNEEGIVEPILDLENKDLIAYGLNQYIQGIKDFLREYAKNTVYIEDEIEGVKISLFYRKYMAQEADDDLLNYIAEMPYKCSGRERKASKYAPVLTSEEIRLLSTCEGYKKIVKLYEGTNFELSKKRCNQKELEYWKKLRGFPVNDLKDKIVLYGAGRYGKVLYEAIKESETKQVVQWIDRNYDGLCKENEKLSPIEAIGEVDYDQIVIAILNLSIANEVKQNLIDLGIEEGKIITYEFAL